MKIKPDDYERLEMAILATFASRIITRRQRWNCFHAACYQSVGLSTRLYAYLTDEHIDSALRSIFKRGASK